MARRIVLAVFAVVALLAILAAWLAWRDVAPATATAMTGAVPARDCSEPATNVLPGATLLASQPVLRSKATTEDGRAEGPSGNLLVRVEWADGSAAPGVHVYLGVGGSGEFRTVAELQSDANGQARVRVPAGRLHVSCDRGRHTTAEIEPGAHAEVSLSLWRGVDVEGVVRDGSGAPVPRARIWLTSGERAWCAGAFVSVTDERGVFTVRAAPTGQALAAVAPGFVPSPPVWYVPAEPAPAPVHVDLVIAEPGGELAGRVEDEHGNGVGGAIVAVAVQRDLVASPGPEIGGLEAPRRAFTAVDGSYTIEGLAPGPQRVEVWAARFATAVGECTIQATEVTRLEFRLQRGVIVHGTVRDEDGDPVWRARVTARPSATSASPDPVVFAGPEVLTDISGEYHLARLPAGELHLRAEPTRHRLRSETVGWSEAVVQAEPGARFEWNAQLVAGSTIHGVVRWRDGTPMVSAGVTLSVAGAERASVTTDTKGRFRFVRLQRQAFDVAVRASSWPDDADQPVVRGVWPDVGQIELRAKIDVPRPLEKGSVRGTVVDAGRRIAPDALALAIETGSGSASPSAAIDGASFHFAGVTPGRVRVLVMSGDDLVLCGAWFELQSGEQKDLGALFTEPGGALHVCIDRPAGAETAAGFVHVAPEGTVRDRNAGVDSGQRDLRFDNLSPGRYRVSAKTTGTLSKDVWCTVVAGAVAMATIELRLTVERELVIECTPAQQVTRMLVMGVDGEVLCDGDPRVFGERPYRMPVQLPLGRFTFLVETEGGGKAETTFEMTSLAEDQPPVVLQAK